MTGARILVIAGSVRKRRIGDQVAHWVAGVGGRNGALEPEVVDLRDWPLPMDDEPIQPRRGGTGGYVEPHTRAWSGKIASADGYVFVSPQYNWGYPAALKNALDHLYHEWTGKPAAIVTYGHRGGVKAAAQLRDVLSGLHMNIAPTMPALFLKDDILGPDGRLIDPAALFAEAEASVAAAFAEIAAAPPPA